ncbi:hypothetical protein D3C72_677020 [compost metagenome]
MAYLLIADPTHTTIPQRIIDFATQTLGWTAAGANRVAAPGSDAGITFEIGAPVSTAPYRNRNTVTLMNGNTQTAYAMISAPYIMLVDQAPTKMHLFGSAGPVPYVAAVVEYTQGFFRHLYFGRLEKLGDYTGGEVVAGSTVYAHYNNDSYDEDDFQYLFNGFQSGISAAAAGGVRLNHAELGGVITAPFRAASSRAGGSQTLAQNCVLGGFRDNVNDQQVARGVNTFAGAQLLVPVNLYLTREASRISPIGKPPGVRLVNMTNIDPGTAINVGGKTWRCFPQFRKGEATHARSSSSLGTNYTTTETSYIVGYAYLED